MSKLRQDGSFHSGTWDATSKRPIVDGKFEDPVTGELRSATRDQYSGPPDVDILITNIHESGGTYRSQRPFPVEKVLWNLMKVVHEEGLGIHSLNATQYSVTLVLAHEFVGEEGKGFGQVADRMSNGLWEA